MNFSYESSTTGYLQSCLILALLVGLFLLPILGIVFLLKSLDQKNYGKAVLSILIPLIYVVTIVSLALNDLSKSSGIKTLANASPKDVPFLELPPDATQIGYWQDGANWYAEFNLREKNIKKVLPKISLLEITEPVHVKSYRYGDSTSPPYQQFHQASLLVLNGLFYHTEQSNGGGYYVVYDRRRQRLYFHYSAR